MDSLKTVKCDWGYKWTPTPDRILHEGVKGPLTQPMLAVPFPCTFEDDTDPFNCEEEVKKCYYRGGIPDPWNEYVVVKRGCLPADHLPKKDVKITRHLWQNHLIDFGQGIPDPWRCAPPMNRHCRKYLYNSNKEMYEMDKIRCPNCDRELLIYCLNEFDESKKEEPTHEVEKPVEETPVEESISEEKILKDASVETDEVEVKIVEMCDSKEHKPWDCSNAQCDSRRVAKPKCRFRVEDESSDSCCSCPHNIHPHGSHRDIHAPTWVHNFLPFLPTNQPKMQSIPGREQPQYEPPANSQIPTQQKCHPWFSPGFFVCGGRRNGHFLELKLVCPKCKSGKKKRRKAKQKPANANPPRNECTRCRCKNGKDHSRGPFVDDVDLDSSGIYKITRVRNSQRCHCNEGASHSAKDKQCDRDFVQLLRMLGHTDLYTNKRNTLYDESIVNLDPFKIVGTSQHVTQAMSPPSLPTPSSSHWKYPPNSQTPARKN